MVREQVGDNPVYKVSPETGGRPLRILHRNLLLQVIDLPLDTLQGPGAATFHSQGKMRRPVRTTPTQGENQTKEPSD